MFPLTVFGAGMSKPKDFAADRTAIEILRKQSKERVGFGYAITWEERNFRRLGMQKVPSEVTFPTQDDYVRFLSKTEEVRQFQAAYELIRRRCPATSNRRTTGSSGSPALGYGIGGLGEARIEPLGC